MKTAHIEVPATSANLGPGFDTLGMALDMVDIIHVDFDTENDAVLLVEVQGAAEDLHAENNFLCTAYRRWGTDTGIRLPGARFTLESRIPVGKGLGSSAACVVGGLIAGAVASGAKEYQERVIRLSTAMEGHPDNCVAATIGGMTTAFCDGDQVHVLHVANHLSLGVAVFVPCEPLLTSDARAILPEKVPFADAVFDVARVAYLTTALIWGRWEQIGAAMQDRLHQPYRAGVAPHMDCVISRAVEAGAYGAALSGGGPSIIALGPEELAERFAAAMESGARDQGWDGKSLVTRMRHTGARVVEEKEGQ